MKISFDLAKSLKLSPPVYPKGVKFINRLILNRDKVQFNKEDQTYRVQVNLETAVPKLKDSYTAKGFIYTKPPQVVRVSKTNPKFYKGFSGHNRDEAQDLLEWETAIYDIVEFDTPLDELKLAYTLNDHPPETPSKYEDIIKGLNKASEEMIDLTDDQKLKDLIDDIAPGFTKTGRKRIFKKYRENNSKYESIQPYGGEKANKTAMELMAPMKGDFNYDDIMGEDGNIKYKGVNRYGFVKEPGGYKTLLHDGFKLWLREGASDNIYVTGYVKDPTPKNLVEKRTAWKKELNKMEDFIYTICSKLTDMSVKDIKSKGKYPFVFNGFLPHNKTPDITNGGRATEAGLVDVNGKSIK